MTAAAWPNKMSPMNKSLSGAAVLLIVMCGAVPVFAQKDADTEPTSWVYFSVVKDDNGKPVRNAAVVLHPVTPKGKQERGGMELKTDPDGKTNYDGIPYGVLRVQVLAHGFQTYGEDFDIEKSKTEITIKLKRPQGQYSVYDDHNANATPRQETAPPPPQEKKPD
jgi:Carboxypeptidase regulatory-like domain